MTFQRINHFPLSRAIAGRVVRVASPHSSTTDPKMDRLESDIMAYLPTILRGADLEKSTVKSLQKELETKLGMGLSEKKNFIREQVRAARPRIEFFSALCVRECVCGFEIL